MAPVGMFEISGIGFIIFLVGLVYMMTIGQRMLPDHDDQQLTEEYKLQKYLTEIVVMPDSPLVGQLVFASDLTSLNFRMLNIIRGEDNFLPDFRTRIREGDVLLVEGEMNDLMKVKETKGIEIMADVILEKDLQTEQYQAGRNHDCAAVRPDQQDRERSEFPATLRAGSDRHLAVRRNPAQQDHQHSAPDWATYCWCRALPNG